MGYAGDETGCPLEDAGALLVPSGDRDGLARALTRVLVDDVLSEQLRRRNVMAYQQHFAWEVIAQRYKALCRV